MCVFIENNVNYVSKRNSVMCVSIETASYMRLLYNYIQRYVRLLRKQRHVSLKETSSCASIIKKNNNNNVLCVFKKKRSHVHLLYNIQKYASSL